MRTIENRGIGTYRRPRMPPRALPTPIEIGRRIAAARAASGMTQLEVAIALHDAGRSTSMSTYVRWESTGSIRLDDAVAVAALFGVTLNQLAGIDEMPTPSGEQRASDGPAPRDPDDALRAMEAAEEAVRKPPTGPGSRRSRRGGARRNAPSS